MKIIHYFFTSCVLILIAFLYISLPTRIYAENEYDLVLNRIMIDPTSCSDFDCEWIELKNISSEEIDLSNYKYNGSKMNPFIVYPNERLIIAKELIDGSDTDLESFEARWGDNSGIWGDSPIESIRAVDDSILGISINLSNTGGTITLEEVNGAEATSFTWDNKYIAYYKYKNIFYGFNNESLLSLEWLNDNVAPIIDLDINGVNTLDNLTTQITSKQLNFDLSLSTDNTYITEFSTIINFNGDEVYTSNMLNTEFLFDKFGSYTIVSEVTDLNNNKSTITNYFKVLESFNSLYINEVYTGMNEIKGWVEFYNNNDFDLELDSYSIEYNGTKLVFAHNTKIRKGEYFVLELQDNINSYQCLNIYQFDELIDELCIEDQIIDKSYNKDVQEHYLAPFTKGYTNISNNVVDNDTSDNKVYSIGEITDLLINKTVNIIGIVNSNTNLFNKDYIYIQKDNRALKVNTKDIKYKYKFGDEIVITGILIKDNELKYNIKASKIELSTSDNKLEPQEIGADSLMFEHEGMLVTLSGTIEKSNGNEFYIVGYNNLKVVLLEEWGIVKKKGDKVTVIGVLSYYKYGGEIKYSFFPTNKESVMINDEILVSKEAVLSEVDDNIHQETLANAGIDIKDLNYLFSSLVFITVLLMSINSRIRVVFW